MFSFDRHSMAVLALLSMAALLTFSSADEASEEKDHHPLGMTPSVDIANLLLDYNKDQAPNSSMTVSLSIYVTQASWSKQKLKATFYFRQKWNDHRLKFAADNGKDTLIPMRFDIWEPDTFFVNAIRTSSSGDRFRRLSPDGTVFKSVKLTATLACPTTAAQLLDNDGVVDCEIEIESYGFATRYQWIKKENDDRYNEKTQIKALFTNATTDTPKNKGAFSVYHRASVYIQIQTALTKQVIEYIMLEKSDL